MIRQVFQWLRGRLFSDILVTMRLMKQPVMLLTAGVLVALGMLLGDFIIQLKDASQQQVTVRKVYVEADSLTAKRVR